MAGRLRIIGVPGSLRKGSYNRGLLRAAAELAPERLEIETFDLRGIPLYDGDVEREGMPAEVSRLREAVAGAEGVLIVTPEYNHGVPGVVKNAVDWLSRPPRPQAFEAKPVAIMGASPGRFGTRGAQYQLRQSLTPLNAFVMPQPQILISGAKAMFDEEPRLVDEGSRERVARFLEAFGEWVARFT